MTDKIDFWFSVGSTYTYLAVNRLADVERETGVQFNWRPFSVRAIMQEMNNVPFIGKQAKIDYMWRDIGRRAAKYGLSPKLPAQYPLKEFDLVNRVAVLAQIEGWCPAFVRSSYQLWFEEGIPAGDEPNLSRSIKEAGQEPARVLELAKSEKGERAYIEATNEARALGLFGSPTFVVNGAELFWGDDRLEDAIEYLRATRD